ncbi:hypothetical protein AGABI1DRAFT_103557 [Agaricus bisporus var. burnettii JB137-S8]|uniref:Homing endonuclease LAGLIDADG domain-containing protein n=1 Tax=Agaricus bisporus var. burnettii (strain JB137-S8 / ATCC MYA-4627 / FGSC 10392) TaxID=597362 RepID=K5VGU8_AGABU|nr:uncharacterized protein AGABI1DRAFT_103557 [Agaricus bisporus var. burnettii JB137-S8]EKM73554.1 hypothetical protein AGABI1DRAFT_103557 [Agaricus bisporus var. burnettii JB137-S8]
MFFGGIGKIYTYSNDKIIPHFERYQLITKKQADYLLFKKIALLIEQGEHLTVYGLQAIINIRASLNLGLSEVLKAAFPYTIPFTRPHNTIRAEIQHSEWMAGFITGEGRNKAGVGVQLVFQVSQHVRDEVLLRSFETYFKCGQYSSPLQKEWGYYQCTKFSDNYNIIIPFFNQYPIQGAKAKDYLDWVKAAEIIKNGEHLTKEGSSKIINLKAAMNTGRKIE